MREITHDVYPHVNQTCNTALHALFRVSVVTSTTPIDVALQWARDAGMNQSAFAGAIGATPQDVTNWKKRGMPAEWHAPVAAKFGRRVEELLGLVATTETSSAQAARAPVSLADNQDYPSVRRVRLKLQAGSTGWAVEDVENGPPVVFRKDWFTTHNYQPEKLLACRVQGASMEPTLYDGDLVVVNTAQHNPKDGRCFAMNYEGTMAIKRLVRDAGEWIIRSDNPDKIRYSDKKAHESVILIGEIIYRQSERI